MAVLAGLGIGGAGVAGGLAAQQAEGAGETRGAAEQCSPLSRDGWVPDAGVLFGVDLERGSRSLAAYVETFRTAAG